MMNQDIAAVMIDLNKRVRNKNKQKQTGIFNFFI